MRLPAVLTALAVVTALSRPLGAEPLVGRALGRASDLAEPVASVPPTAAEDALMRPRFHNTRIRPTERRVEQVLRAGLDRSAIVHSLVNRVEASDVVVYIGTDATMSPRLAGRLAFVGHGGRHRFLRVMLNPGFGLDLTIAALAHELQHVVEVIEHPDVQSEASLEALYRRIGRGNQTTGRPGWETDAAQQVTFDVRRELRTAAS